MGFGTAGEAAREQNRWDMETWVGFCPTGKGAPAVGRLITRKEKRDFPSHGAFLAVLDEPTPVVADQEGQMGVILVGSSTLSGAQLAEISCPILMIPELPARCMGRIGLLDPSSSTLFVSPDLATVQRYAEYWNREYGVDLGNEVAQADGALLQWEYMPEGGLTVKETEWLLDCRRTLSADSEDRWYELFCDVADCAVGTPVTVVVPFERTANERSGFRAIVRGIFRAAIYGRFSVLVSGCLSEGDVRSVREALHRSFCELESEGREFNGYIPKGILIDRPVLLFAASAFEGVDFICLETEELFYGLTGRRLGESGEDAELWRMVDGIWSDWSARMRQKRVRALLGDSFPTYALCRTLLRCGIRDWFFLKSDLYETKRYLRELEETHREGLEKIFQEKGEKFQKNT